MSDLRVKLSFGSDLRRRQLNGVTNPNQLTLTVLAREVADAFGADILKTHSLRYVDEDGDPITVGSEGELKEALKVLNGSCYKFSIVKSTPGTKSLSDLISLKDEPKKEKEVDEDNDEDNDIKSESPKPTPKPACDINSLFGDLCKGTLDFGSAMKAYEQFTALSKELGEQAGGELQGVMQELVNVANEVEKNVNVKNVEKDVHVFLNGSQEQLQNTLSPLMDFLKTLGVEVIQATVETPADNVNEPAKEPTVVPAGRTSCRQMCGCWRSWRSKPSSASNNATPKLSLKPCVARFVKDVTLPDGTAFAPEQKAFKIWRLRNSGRTVWPAGCRLVHVGGDKLQIEEPAGLMSSVPVNGEVDVVACLKTPKEAGRYSSFFRMAMPDGTRFGHRVWVDVLVVGEPKKEPEVVSKPEPVVEEPKNEPEVASKPEVVSKPEPVVEEPSSPEVTPKFQEQLRQLADMGFNDVEANSVLLELHNGQVMTVVHELLTAQN